ncbi:MAG: TolC family protein [Aquificae bacterium]|nr:TolC family protein [Aquificota bacterium]
MIKIFVTLLLIYTASYSITLEEIVNLAKQRAVQIKISELDLKKVQAQIKEVKSNLYPKIILTGNYSYIDKNLNTGFTLQNQYRASIMLVQKIFDKTIFESLKYAKQSISLQKAIKKEITTQIIDTAQKLYYAVLLKKQIVKIKKETLSYWEKNLKLTEEKFKLGLTNKFNFLRAKAQYNLALSDYQEASVEYKKSLIDLKRFLFLEEITPPEEDLKKLPFKKIDFSKIEKNNPQLNLYKEKIKTAEKQINIVKATNYPTLELQADYRTFNTIRFPELKEFWLKGYTISVNLNFVMYDGEQKKSKIIQTKIDKQKEELNLKDKKEQIKGQYEKIIEEIKAIETKLKALQLNLQALKEALKLSTERYRYGLTDIIEVLNTQKNYDEAYLNYILTIYNYNIKILDLYLLAGYNI